MQIKENLIAVAGYTVAAMALVYTAASLMLCLSPSMAEHAFGMLSMQNRMIPPFADLRAITALAGCSADIDHVMRGISAGCDPYGRSGGLGYPPLIFELARSTGASASWTGPAAMVCGVLFIAIILRDIKHSGLIKRHQAWLLAAILIGFPTQLGLERMNLDIAIFIGLRLLAWTREADSRTGIGSWLSKATCFCLALLLGGAKVYPSLGLLLWLGCELGIQKRCKSIDLWIAAGAITGGLTAVPWILSGDQYAVPAISLTSHGLIAGRSGEAGGAFLSIVSASVACLGYAYSLKCFRNTNTANTNGPKNNRERAKGYNDWPWIRLSFATWLVSYAVTASFDYRLVLLYPALIGLAANIGSIGGMQSKQRRLLAVASVLTIVYMLTPLTYMASESLQIPITSFKGWLYSPLRMTLKYGSASLSRLLDSIGLPFIAGTAAGYIQASTPSGGGK